MFNPDPSRDHTVDNQSGGASDAQLPDQVDRDTLKITAQLEQSLTLLDEQKRIHAVRDSIDLFTRDQEHRLSAGRGEEVGKAESALRTFFIDLAPQHSREAYTGLMLLANYQRQLGQLAPAIEGYLAAQKIAQQAFDGDASNRFASDAWSQAVQCHLRQGELKAAESLLVSGKHFSTLEEQPSVQSTFWYVQGLISIVSEDHGSALEALDRAVHYSTDPADPSSSHHRFQLASAQALAAERSGEMIRARKLFYRNAREALREYGPDSEEAYESHTELVRFLRDQGNMIEASGAAESLFKRVSEYLPDKKRSTQALLALCLSESGDIERAEEYISPLWEEILADPPNAQQLVEPVLWTKSIIALSRGDYEEALELRQLAYHYAEARPETSAEDLATQRLAIVAALVALGRDVEAKEHCEQIIEEANREGFSLSILISAHMLKAGALMDEARFDEAFEEYHQGQLLAEKGGQFNVETTLLYLGGATAAMHSENYTASDAIALLEIGLRMIDSAGLQDSINALPFLEKLSELYDRETQQEQKSAIDRRYHLLKLTLDA